MRPAECFHRFRRLPGCCYRLRGSADFYYRVGRLPRFWCRFRGSIYFFHGLKRPFTEVLAVADTLVGRWPAEVGAWPVLVVAALVGDLTLAVAALDLRHGLRHGQVGAAEQKVEGDQNDATLHTSSCGQIVRPLCLAIASPV